MNKKIATMAIAAMVAIPAFAGGLDIADGDWAVTFNPDSKTVNYFHRGKTIAEAAYVTAMLGDSTRLNSKDYPRVKLSSKKVNDGYGKGKRYTYTYSGLKGSGNLVHNIYVYDSLPYILVEAAVVNQPGAPGASEISPMKSDATQAMPLPASGNHIYDMPFANDNWATFNAYPMKAGDPITSCEMTAIYNADTRQGIVIGSVDHSTWKSCVTVDPASDNSTDGLEAKAGYVSPRTWDVFGDKASSTRHGVVSGRTVTSPRFMVGFYDDWRDALEAYGDANTVVCPKMEWDKDEALFGWQSWGGMEFGLNYESAMSVLDFFEKELLPVGFHNAKGRCHMVLDSGWTALNDDQLRDYVNKCKELGIVAGIYTTPFSYWGNEQQVIDNTPWEGGNLGEMVLKTNGRYRQILAMSLDPTHPAVKEWNRRQFDKFKELGFEFVKIDFMNNGSQEADSYYLPEITTGMQAYNYGMDYIKEFAGDMMLDFSIAPVFPAKAHVRRIGCDAWGDLPQSMYTINCINGSWWLDRVYAFNDPDHMCLSRVPFNGKGSNDEQEARIRFTCGLMTGMTLFGGTYAYHGPEREYNGKKYLMEGSGDERARAVKFASNKGLTEMARIGRSFRPVEGRFDQSGSLWSNGDIKLDSQFVMDTDDAFYYIVFNYATGDYLPIEFTPDFARLGINPADFTAVTELWEGETAAPENLKVKVPAKDVRIYRFERPGYKPAEI